MIKTYEHKCFRDVLKAALYLDDLALGRGMQEQKQAVLVVRTRLSTPLCEASFLLLGLRSKKATRPDMHIWLFTTC